MRRDKPTTCYHYHSVQTSALKQELENCAVTIYFVSTRRADLATRTPGREKRLIKCCDVKLPNARTRQIGLFTSVFI